MEPDQLFQFVAPLLKAHPALLYALAVSMVVSAAWKLAPARAVAFVRGKSPRLAGLLDALVAATPTAPSVAGALWHGVVRGETKPERMTRAELDALVADALAKRAEPRVIIEPEPPQ